MHKFYIIYKSGVELIPTNLGSDDPEVGPLTIHWIAIANLTLEICSNRNWIALQISSLVSTLVMRTYPKLLFQVGVYYLIFCSGPCNLLGDY